MKILYVHKEQETEKKEERTIENKIAKMKKDIGCNFLVVSALAKSKINRFQITYLVHKRECETVLHPSSSPTVSI